MRGARLVAGLGSGGLLALGLATGSGPTVVGCTTHQCDGDIVCIDSAGNAKSIHDASECTPILTDGVPVPNYNLNVEVVGNPSDGNAELVWDTSSFLGTWLDFGPQRTFIVQFPPGLAGHLPHSFDGWVSSDNDAAPDASHLNFTNTAGQLLEYTFVNDTRMNVYNNTCVDYGLRFEVRAFAGGADAGTSAEASVDPSADTGADPDASADDAAGE
jgi:hypothetical protein